MKRKDFCKSLSAFIKERGKKEEGLTITLNGGFGSGKTTFLGFLEKELSYREGEEEKWTVIYYDCWKNSVFDEPLLPISVPYRKNSIQIRNLGRIKDEDWQDTYSRSVRT